MLQYEDGTPIKITAEWARKQATIVLSDKVLYQIEACEKAIKTAVTRNDFSCSVGIYLHELTVKELQSRGFKIDKQIGDEREGSYTNITW